MAVTSGFFNSINHDRTYNADQMSTYFEGLISNGIYENIGTKLGVTAGTGMVVNVGIGRAIIQSHWIKNDSVFSLTLDPSDVQLSRIDAIVLRLDNTESGRTISITVKKGESVNLNPQPPVRTTNNDIYELFLAYVAIDKNTTQITQSMITDLRGTSMCGWVTGIIKQVDTSQLALQWQNAYEQYYAQSTAAFDAYMRAKQAEFDLWLTTLTQELRVDTTLHKYQNTVSVITTTSEITIGIPEYDSNNDILFPYINGVYFVEGTDYIISGTGDSAKIILNKAIKGQNSITFIVIKSIIGEGSNGIIAGNSLAITNSVPNGIHGNAIREDV